MKLTFLGTKAYTDTHNRRHRRHSSLLIEHLDRRIMIDCGSDWKDKWQAFGPDAIILTHAHPDHAFGLENGATCPVYATRETWKKDELKTFPLVDKHLLPKLRSVNIEGLEVKAFPVLHSLRAPAVGLRITAMDTAFFYVPDLVSIPYRHAAMKNIAVYIGDGSAITKSLVRRLNGKLLGHTTIHAQIGWCASEGVNRALFTHCGTEIVSGDERKLVPKIRRMGLEKNVEAGLAYDGMVLDL